ncbi:hypothetical protein ACFRFH_12015 [Leifsonia sp. NPDC056824]
MSEPMEIELDDRTILAWPCEKHQAYFEQGLIVLTCKHCKLERA